MPRSPAPPFRPSVAPTLRRSALPPRRPSALPSSARGFALLITITLVAFLVLVLVTLATLTRVETQVATNSQLQAQARQNALMALNIALGQLQKYTGPDQRVTAPADLAAAADGTRLPSGAAAQNTASVNGTGNGLGPVSGSSIQTGSRWWTGVWGRAGASYAIPARSIYEETPSPVLLNWLVSGNEDRAFTTDTDGLVASSDASGATAASTAPFTPGMPVNWAAAGLNPAAPQSWTGTTGYADLEIKASGQKAVLLVGPRTAGVDPVDGEAAAERYVVAPLRDIDVPSASIGLGSSGDTTVGRYAWWVGDEGVKASYALADPHAGQTNPAASAEARLRLMSAARSGIELIPGWEDYPAANDLQAKVKFDRVLDLQQAPLLTASLPPESRRAAFHDFTRLSRGLLSNTLDGGLRKDLTHYFESSSAWNGSPLKGNGIIPAPYSPDWGSGDLAPKWDWLHSFYNTNPSGGTLQVRPESATEVGVSPVITQFRLMFSTDRDAMNEDPPDMKNLARGQSFNLPIRTHVVFVLANPYNTTLTAADGELEFILNNTDTGTGDLFLQVKMGQGKGAPLSPPARFSLLRSINSTDPDGVLDTVKFRLPAISIPPGEAITLAVSGSGQTLSGTNAPDAEPVNTINLDVKSFSNPILSDDYFTARNTLDFETPPAPPPPAPAPAKAGALTWDVGAQIELTLRRSDGAPLQRIGPFRFNKANELNSFRENIFSATHLKLIAPARRELDWRGYTEFVMAYYTYGRLYQDFNIRAGTITQPNIARTGGTYALQTPPSYGAGNVVRAAGGTNADTIRDAFLENLLPTAPWAEDFGDDYRTDSALSGVFFDFPRKTPTQLPVMSIGQLQHASLSTNDITPNGTISYHSAYAIGNSYHHPHVTRSDAVQTRVGTNPFGPTTRYFDFAYLLNTALWDGYFFSGIPNTGADFDPQNARYQLAPGATATQARSADSAVSLTVNGAFNINSTSKNAWVALLGGLNGLRVNDDNENDGVPYPRSLWQREHSEATGGSFQSSGTGDNAYAGYRRLTAVEIDRLATEIVKRVRARGPFTTLSHFINRSLVAASDDFNPTINDANGAGNLAAPAVPQGRGLSGPLQAAIDSYTSDTNPAGSDINKFITVAGDLVTGDAAGPLGDRVLFNGEIVTSTGSGANIPNDDNNRTPFYADKIHDAPHIEWDINEPAPPGPAGRTSTGIPGWLLQGDLLQALGPALSARSDTFTIRAYGEVLNPADSSEKQAVAWCEAVVQRLPEYIVPETSAGGDAPEATATNPTNIEFGRRYQVIGFRWLTADDI